MKERIHTIQERENMTQKEFAAAIGISQASLSSIYNGHTLATNRHVEAIHKRFPEINTDWLMFGEGEMDNTGVSGPAVSRVESKSADESVRPDTVEEADLFSGSYAAETTPAPEATPQGKPIVQPVIKYIDKPKRRVREIQIIYDDGFLETFVLKPDNK